MPLLTYSVADFTPLTKILSADVNSKFTSIKTLLNVTGLDDTNIQVNGLTRVGVSSRLKTGTPYALVVNDSTGAMGETVPATAGLFLGSNGTQWVGVGNPLTTQFNVVLGSAAQVTAGTATHSSYVTYSAAAADGDRVLVLPTYSTSEAWTIAKKVFITGLGNSSQVQGAVTFATGSSYANLTNLRITGGVTVNTGIVGVLARGLWLATGTTFTDNATSQANYLEGMVE